MVGGAAITEEYARQIGAVGFAPSAPETVALVKQLVAASAASRASDGPIFKA
jgi:methanogenic corrinoid protein MtbC1